MIPLAPRKTDRTPSPSPAPDASAMPHGRIEDIYALIVGCILVTLGLSLLSAANLVTGGIAGIALLLSYVVPVPAGILFTLINIPFLAFAWRALGPAFMLKTLIVNGGIAALSLAMRASVGIHVFNPAFAAIVGGTVIGMGILALARHGAGVGGTGILTLWLHKRHGVNAGLSQIAIDCVILLVSLSVLSGAQLGWSALSAAAISGVLIAWHRPGRYTGS